MKKIYSLLACAIGISALSVNICNAQSATLALNAPKTAVKVDGNSQEWGDSSSYYYNPEKKIHYAISNDKENLYLIVKTKDPEQERDILYSGISFSVDTKGRKKTAFTTTFPSNGSGGTAFAGMTGGADETLQQKAMRATVTKFKKITVNGFKDINEDDLGTTNPYNILAVINYEEDGSLVYEESIPLELFHAGDLAKGEWSFNIKLNGAPQLRTGTTSKIVSTSDATTTTTTTTAPAASSGRGGGGRSAPTRKSSDPSAAFQGSQSTATTPDIDFWGKFTLAKAQ